MSTEPNKMLCKDLLKVGSHKGKAVDYKALTSKAINKNRSIFNTNRKDQFAQYNEINILRPICQIIPEISDIPDQYGNVALMPSLSVSHEGSV